MPISKANMRERKRLERAIVNPKSIPNQGITETWYPNKRADNQGHPITPVKLSDGQKWYPLGKMAVVNETGLSDYIYLNIASTSQRYGRFEERIEKAFKYQECKKLLEVTA